jgi:hypothetical protein
MKNGEKLSGNFKDYFLDGYGVKMDSAGRTIEHGYYRRNVLDRRPLAA